jgi:hypothetical protein
LTLKKLDKCGRMLPLCHDGLSLAELTAIASDGVPIRRTNMTEHTAGMVRHVLTSVGGLLVMLGYTDEMTMATVVGAIMTLVGFVWSWRAK